MNVSLDCFLLLLPCEFILCLPIGVNGSACLLKATVSFGTYFHSASPLTAECVIELNGCPPGQHLTDSLAECEDGNGY